MTVWKCSKMSSAAVCGNAPSINCWYNRPKCLYGERPPPRVVLIAVLVVLVTALSVDLGWPFVSSMTLTTVAAKISNLWDFSARSDISSAHDQRLGSILAPAATP